MKTFNDTYQRKRETAQAWQFTEENKHISPQWVTSMFLAGRIYFQGGPTPYVTVSDDFQFKNRPGRAYLGDWLMLGHDGWLWVETEEIFNAKWEAIPRPCE